MVSARNSWNYNLSFPKLRNSLPYCIIRQLVILLFDMYKRAIFLKHMHTFNKDQFILFGPQLSLFRKRAFLDFY